MSAVPNVLSYQASFWKLTTTLQNEAARMNVLER